MDRAAPARAARPHLVLVATPATARAVPGRHRLAALLAGLASGFVLAAFATVLGGGNPAGSLLVAAICGALLGAVLVRARVVTVRSRRRRRRRAATAAAMAAMRPADRPATGAVRAA